MLADKKKKDLNQSPDDLYPFQPLHFCNWLAGKLTLPDLTCHAALFEVDGSLTLKYKIHGRDGRLRWTPEGILDSSALKFDNIDGSFLAVNFEETEKSLIMNLLKNVLEKYNPVLLSWGPSADNPVFFSVDSLGEFLKSKITPEQTRWDQFVAREFIQKSPSVIEFRFSSDDNKNEVKVALTPVSWRETGDKYFELKRSDLKFTRIIDTRTPQQKNRLEYQVERLLGFAVGRILGRNPRILISRIPDSQNPADKSSCIANLQADDYLNKYYSLVRHEAFIRRWDADDRWRRFLYPVSKCIVNLFRLGNDDTLISHESLECILNEPPWIPSDATFFLNRRKIHIGEYFQNCNLFITDINASDVVGGGSMSKLSSALKSASDLPRSSAVVVVSGCLPNVMGDNPVPVMKNLENKTSARFYWVGNSNDFSGYTAKLIHDRLQKVAPADAHRDPRGVAIVGGGSEEENSELLNLLSDLSLHPLGVVLPDVSFDCMRKVAEASLFIWANQSALKDITTLAFSDLPVTLLRPGSPVGIKGTLEWLSTAAKHFYSEPRINEILQAIEREKNFEHTLAQLKKRTEKQIIAFVVSPEEFEIFMDTSPLYAFSLLSVILEMGFDVRFISYGSKKEYSSKKDQIKESGFDSRISFRFFQNPAELRNLVQASDTGLVFSNFTADPRIIDAGRNVFSEVFFEMGINGFFRSAYNLLHMCENRPLAGFEGYLNP
jgi:nitrogenase molybdenum-iron protein alpha/beta subunit